MNLTPRPAARTEPDAICLFGQGKIGKNTLLAALPSHYIFELQPKGMDAIDGGCYDYYLTWQALDAGIEEFKQLPVEKRPRFLCVDHLGMLESFCFDRALAMYKKKFNTDASSMSELIAKLPNKTGWHLPRVEFSRYLHEFALISDVLVMTAHVKNKSIGDNVQDLDPGDIDLTPGLSRMITSSFPLIGRLVRKVEKDSSSLLLCTTPGGKGVTDVSLGSNFGYLSDRTITISKGVKSPLGWKVSTFWHEVFPSLKVGTDPAK